MGRLKGYKVTMITYDRISKEKLSLLKYHGASVIVTPSDAAPESNSNYVNVAKKYANQNW
ncbi:hypothetical protein NC803_05365 [Brenneria sp. KBI 447]|uniref:Uncharacterized protein n=1 Tax=Brenneria izbisi TaxID=2939450 RepID=A0AA42C1Y5_9GAMM|nr:hypothetical protein [Brenneria izbisi]MCV9881696.1 hypothetical protein [Brenneria izbisi]